MNNIQNVKIGDNGFMSLEMKMEGLADIEKRLSTLYPKVAKRHVRTAMRAGAKDVVRAAQMLVPEKTQNLGHTLGFTFLRNKTGGNFVIRFGWITKIRTMMGMKKVANDGYYGHWVEFGHAVVPKGQAGAARRAMWTKNASQKAYALRRRAAWKERFSGDYKRVAPKPHFQPAWDRMHGVMINKTIDYLKDKIMKEWEA